MKKAIIPALILVALTGCTSMHTFESPPQNHNLKGTNQTVKITGNVHQTIKEGVIQDEMTSKLSIYFDGVLKISGYLGLQNTGEFTGQNFENKKTSASCSSKFVTQISTTLALYDTNCIVFIDNERTVTLTF